MTYSFGSYLLLLTGWAFLLPAIISALRRGAKTRGLVAAFAVNALLAGYEAYMTFVWSKTVINPIRVDILAVMLILGVINFVTGWSLLSRPANLPRAPFAERAAGMLLVLIALNALGAVAHGFWDAGKASQTFRDQQKIEFETMFRDAGTIKYFFGDIGGGKGWAGHYAAEPSSGSAMTRLVINAEGKVWLFFKCHDETECVYVDGMDAALTKDGDSITVTGLKPKAGVWTGTLDLKKESRDKLRLSLDIIDPTWKRSPLLAGVNTNLSFVRVAPPLFASTSVQAETVAFRGVFSNGYFDGNALFVVQVWIWQDGHKVFGRYLRRGWQTGTHAAFISTEAFNGTYDPRSGEVAFTVNEQESFRGTFAGDDVLNTQVLWAGRVLESLRLKKKTLIPGFAFEFAPLTTQDATAHWLETSAFGKMIEWDVPASFDPAAW